MSESLSHLFLDTNVLVRYLIADPVDVARRIAGVIEGSEILAITPVVLAETALVLSKSYQRERDDVVAGLAALVQRNNVRLIGLPKSLALEALFLCRGSKRISFADAMLWAEARNLPGSRVLTLDRRFPAQGIEIEQLEEET